MTFMILSLILAGFGVLMMVMSIIDYCVNTEEGFGYYHKMKECAVGIFLVKFASALVLEISIMFWNFFYSFELNSAISWLIIGIMILIVAVLMIIGFILKEDEGLYSMGILDTIMEIATFPMLVGSFLTVITMIINIY